MSDVLLASSRHAVPVDAVTPDGLASLIGRAAQWAGASGFKAAAGSVLLVPGEGDALGSVLLGLGGGAADRFAAGRLAATLPAGTYRLRDGFGDPALAALAFVLGTYRFTRYRPVEDAGVRLVRPDGVDRDAVLRAAEAVRIARDLINTPANDLGPAELAEAAAGIGRRHGAAIRIVEGSDLERDFPMIHAVGAAATPARAPRLVDIAWGDPALPKVTLVGKGVCFDTGGLDIKPSSGMLLMKKDMGGAANILGLAHMVMDAGLPVNLRILIPAVENAISGPAFRPGDVLRSRKGITVEIGNTDAEGRLVLADALALAAEESPDLVIDLATLTGAARVALGPEVVPFYTRDDALAADLAGHGEAEADPLWRLPLWAPYRTMLDSKVADINNAGSAPFAGSITAALFLARFVPETTRWFHADIYGWNPSARPGRPEGGEAQAIRALYGLLAQRYPR
ncbi:MAG: leucyl aminopeptidase family protein [Rhizobiales bacterium]|nr:leucyl aminopeptidase family protein [Hyphomicrobiales bacterium]